jgi:hypothetical protein
MAVVSTRPGIIVKVPVKFPARVTVTPPLTLTKSGADYTFGADTSAILGGDVWVWQLHVALHSIGQFFNVNDEVPGDPSSTIHILWNRGARTEYGDTLSDFIESKIGTSNTTTAYALAAGVIN